MEEKDSAASGSFSLSDNDSPPPALSVPFIGSVTPIVNTDAIPNTGLNMDITVVAGNGGGTGTETGTGIGTGTGTVDSSMKKKRGRPRKYDADGNLRVPYVSPSPPGFTLTSTKSEYSSSKRGRGRPSPTGNWQLLASLGEMFTNTAGGDFTPHVVTVYTGEDIASKIISFSQKGPRGICVLSANGAVSNVTIRQAGSSGGILTYEGRFEIISLTGSFTVSDKDGMRSRTGGLSVSLAGPDGRVIGGGVAGLLMAASPIQIVVGSFMPNGYGKALKKKHLAEQRVAKTEPKTEPKMEMDHETVTPATPISQSVPIVVAATANNSNNIFSAPPASTNHFIVQSGISSSHGDAENHHHHRPNGVQNLNTVSPSSPDWNNNSSSRPSPDINLSVQVELN